MPPTHAESLREASRLAQGGNPSKALEMLLSSDPGAGAALHHYTVGAIYLQNGQPGEALAHLLRAKALGASLEQISPALSMARTQAEERTGGGGLERASTPLERLGDGPMLFPLESLVATLSLLVALRLWRRPGRGPLRRRSLLACLLLLGAALALAVVHGMSLSSPPARAVAQLEVRSGPGEDFPLLGEAQPGAELRITTAQTSSGWVRVRVSPQLEGWTVSAHVLPLTGAANPGPTEAREQNP